MPMRRRRSTRRVTRRKAPRRARRTIRRGVAERASCKEIYTINNMVSNAPFSDVEQNLGLYKRASAIAANYQFFRVKYIKYKFIARYNTFQATTNEATANPIPLLHYMVDKGGALPTGTSLVQLKAMGAVPIRFTKDIVVVWKPGVAITTENAQNTAQYSTAYKVSPWLMTNKEPGLAGWTVNDTDHKGLYWYLESVGLPGDGTYEYDAEVEVFFEFKKPLLAIAAGSSPATSAIKWQEAQVAAGKVPEANATIPVLP